MHVDKGENIFVLGVRCLALVFLLIHALDQVVNDLLDGANSWMDAEIRFVVASI